MIEYKNRVYFFVLLFFLIEWINPYNFYAEPADKQKEEIYNLASQIIGIIDNKISAVSESDKKKLAELLIEQSEYFLLKMQTTENTDSDLALKDKESYINLLKKTEQIYNFIDYQPGIFLCKSRLLKFEISGIEPLSDYESSKKNLIGKISSYLKELPAEESAQFKSSSNQNLEIKPLPSGSESVAESVSAKSVAAPVKNVNDKSIFSQQTGINTDTPQSQSSGQSPETGIISNVSSTQNETHPVIPVNSVSGSAENSNDFDSSAAADSLPKKIILSDTYQIQEIKEILEPSVSSSLQPFFHQPALLEPKLSYSNDMKISPVLRHILFTEKLEKEFEEIRSQRLLDLTDLKYGNTKLSISGQKTINFSYSNRKYSKNTDSTENSSDFKIDQTLEVKVRGKVGDNVEVNIDYDDQRSSSNRQQLSIDYKSDEHILNKRTNSNIFSGYAAFGDIVLSLPSTEFVSYRRSLFGINGGIKIRNLNYSILKADQITLDIIASRTKGEPGHKEFTGNNSSQIINTVFDVNYVKNKYFKVHTGVGLDTDIDVTSLSVYIDDKNPTNDQSNIDTFAIEVNPNDHTKYNISMNGDTYRIYSFTQLTAVKDYTYDKTKGILTLNSYITDNYAIAVTYTTYKGYATPHKKLIKKDKDSQNSDTYSIYNIKNRYSFGVSNINKNDPDFIFKIQDKNNNYMSDYYANAADSSSAISFLKIFGLDKTGPGPDGLYGTSDDRPDGKIDDDFIDYEDGWVEFPDPQPFNGSGSAQYGLSNPLIYTDDNPTSRFRFYLELKAQSQQFFLNAFDLVRNSEIVKVDGRTLTRNVDYYIDYESGLLIFLDPSLLTKNSKVVVDYERVPFGSSANKTLVGTRFEAIVNPNFKAGTTMIFNTNDKSSEIPTIDAAPQSTSVKDFDMEMRPANLFVNILNKFLKNDIKEPPSSWFDIKLITEVARSEFDPNIFGKAMIDDMESSKDAIDINMNYKSWMLTHLTESQPGWKNLPVSKKGWVTFDETSLDNNIGHKAVLEDNEDNQKSMIISYDLTNDSAGVLNYDTWFAIRTLVSKDGVDISKKKYLEFWIQGADSFNISLDLGRINEDADGDGVLDQEDGLYVNGIPTEKNSLNGVLNKSPNEDVGLSYECGGKIKNTGKGNGRLDSEDMNGDGELDQIESFYRITDIDTFQGEGKIINGIPYKFYRITLGDLYQNSMNSPNNKSIKHIRFIFTRKDGATAAPAGNIYMDYLSIVGSLWLDGDTDNFKAGSKNNIDDNDYASFNEEMSLRKVEDEDEGAVKESALFLKYDKIGYYDYSSPSYKYYAERDFGRSISVAKYEKLIFYVRSSENNGETAFIRLGDQNNYYEYKFKIPEVSSDITKWEKIEIPLMAFRTIVNSINDSSVNPPYIIDSGPYRVCAQTSLVSLYNIRTIKFGVIGDTNLSTGNLFINTLYVEGAIKETGIARKTQWQTKFYKDIFIFNAREDYRENTFRSVDEISSSVSQSFVPEKSSKKSYDGSVAIGRLLPSKWGITLPVSGTYTKSDVVVEPDVVQDVERSKIGTTGSKTQTFSTSFSKDKFPLLKLDYENSETDKDLTESKYKFLSKKLNSSASYSINFNKHIFGELALIKKIPLLNKIPSGKELRVDMNYQYNYTIDDKDYILGTEASAYDKYVTHYKKMGITSKPANWIRLQPNISITDKYHTTMQVDGLENNIVQTSINIDIIKVLGIKPVFDFSRSKDSRYDISRPDSDPIENLDYGAGVKLDIYPVDWWKRLKFLDGRFNLSGKYVETLNANQAVKDKNSDINASLSLDVNIRPNELWKRLKFLTVHYSYGNNVSATYSKLGTDKDFNSIYTDYFSKYIWPWLSKDRIPINEGDTSIIDKRSAANNSQSHTINGQFNFWDPLSLRYAYSTKNSITQSQSSESFSKSLSAQINSRLDLIKSLKLMKKTKKSSLNIDYKYSKDDSGDYKMNLTESLNHDRNIGLEILWTDKFNTVFNMGLPFSKKNSVSESGLTIEKTNSYTPKITWNYYTASPFKLLKPFTNKKWIFDNKLNLNGTINYNLQKTSIQRTDNTNYNSANLVEFGFTVGAQYDMSDFFRMSADLRLNKHQNKITEGDDYIEYGINTKIIIIF